MPTSPNDPDYKDVFAQFRETVESQRIKKRRSIYTPPGYSDPKGEIHREQAKERARQTYRSKRLDGKEEKK